MKINRLEAHDRYEFFTKQEFDIAKTVQNIVDQRPYGDNPFYIFAHTRTIGFDEKYAIFREDMLFALSNPLSYKRKYITIDQVPEKRLIWQPRLTKPKAESNSMLFKAYPGTDNIKILWMIPAEEMWGQFKQGNVTESEIVAMSIQKFKTNKEDLEQPEPDDLADWQIDKIYTELSEKARALKQATLGASSDPSISSPS